MWTGGLPASGADTGANKTHVGPNQFAGMAGGHQAPPPSDCPGPRRNHRVTAPAGGETRGFRETTESRGAPGAGRRSCANQARRSRRTVRTEQAQRASSDGPTFSSRLVTSDLQESSTSGGISQLQIRGLERRPGTQASLVQGPVWAVASRGPHCEPTREAPRWTHLLPRAGRPLQHHPSPATALPCGTALSPRNRPPSGPAH